MFLVDRDLDKDIYWIITSKEKKELVQCDTVRADSSRWIKPSDRMEHMFLVKCFTDNDIFKPKYFT